MPSDSQTADRSSVSASIGDSAIAAKSLGQDLFGVYQQRFSKEQQNYEATESAVTDLEKQILNLETRIGMSHRKAILRALVSSLQ